MSFLLGWLGICTSDQKGVAGTDSGWAVLLQTSAFWVSLSQRWYRSARCSPMIVPQLCPTHFFFFLPTLYQLSQFGTPSHQLLKLLPLVLWSCLTETIGYTARKLHCPRWLPAAEMQTWTSIDMIHMCIWNRQFLLFLKFKICIRCNN